MTNIDLSSEFSEEQFNSLSPAEIDEYLFSHGYNPALVSKYYAIVAKFAMIETDNERLRAENARLRQQVKSLVEAWNEYVSLRDRYAIEKELYKAYDYLGELEAAFLAVQSAQETEEK